MQAGHLKVSRSILIYCMSPKKWAPKLLTNMVLYKKSILNKVLSFTYLIATLFSYHQQKKTGMVFMK